MGGIVGYLGNREARQILVDCLGRLDDRGYDSAGMGTVAGGKLRTLRTLGNSANLRATLKRSPLSGKVGVAQAYRTTRGQAYNAHSSSDGNFLAIEHDGSGANARIVAGLLERDASALEELLRETLCYLQGEFTLVGLSQQEPDRIIAVRRGGTPLMIGHHYDGYIISSDLRAISHYARSYQVLEDGEIAVISYGGVSIFKFDGTPVQTALTEHEGAPEPRHAAAPPLMARTAMG